MRGGSSPPTASSHQWLCHSASPSLVGCVLLKWFHLLIVLPCWISGRISAVREGETVFFSCVKDARVGASPGPAARLTAVQWPFFLVAPLVFAAACLTLCPEILQAAEFFCGVFIFIWFYFCGRAVRNSSGSSVWKLSRSPMCSVSSLCNKHAGGFSWSTRQRAELPDYVRKPGMWCKFFKLDFCRHNIKDLAAVVAYYLSFFTTIFYKLDYIKFILKIYLCKSLFIQLIFQ